MFKKIVIDNFRVLKHIEIDDIKQFNLIVGKNNSGKTSLLECFYQSINPGNAGLLGKINSWKGLDILNTNSWKTLFYRFDLNSKIKINSELSKPLEKRILTLEPKITVSLIETHLEGNYKENEEIIIKDGSSTEKPFIKGIEMTLILKDLEDKKLGTFKSTIETRKFLPRQLKHGTILEPFIIKNSEEYNCPTSGRFDNPVNIFDGLNSRFGKIAIKKLKDPIIETLKKIDPNLRDLESIGDKIYADLDYEELVPLNIMGDGILKILAISTAIRLTENGIILIDEIENGLHYSSQRVLWDVIFDIANKFNVQIIATTHSYECVEAYINSYANLSIKNDDIRLFRIERDKDDFFNVINYNYDEINMSIEQGWEIR